MAEPSIFPPSLLAFDRVLETFSDLCRPLVCLSHLFLQPSVTGFECGDVVGGFLFNHCALAADAKHIPCKQHIAFTMFKIMLGLAAQTLHNITHWPDP